MIEDRLRSVEPDEFVTRRPKLHTQVPVDTHMINVQNGNDKKGNDKKLARVEEEEPTSKLVRRALPGKLRGSLPLQTKR